ncbi:tRNA (adenosine(37)-N6)-threonylcarbamoyltransferase complex ATPase subunit type 1 TsaE [Flavobacteriaceae bacterium]|jgi:tRNA threonylcarbamoyladenosine biosynthesis protein TsaE|nr:tRNA (adenosine(37)-N6)-threonylcarbamoyltransferase complex ATPase subunit type 1 TsaE [Flavobacteriaceae bacterium]MDB4180172.1 tRNA (adenosine(37)-N6)-threonylcarbamoyltransferase complex ATPase subunit type 1 TsaE [Flavobacteriaceae bacterium]MDB4212780.1 tRNA (adenosine(37)-N6)-threonylcarbamoyltransferase complex ATPase subunit type 1 TsaE [Flavobacteriaceae bacterium]MDC0623165.1 tRNA (adenosine(37)-N6)-threonylcarbamoyltransferase complex ATPase subunit type 1 TsaE [Flavobacteriaceae |tara:strand:- start:721 stop:1140 length:420 start_codon:yes stop_codon:yes gene_type:complete
MLKSINYQLKDINLAIDFILKNITSKTLLFNGAMGSGKTTIIKSLVNRLGSTDNVSSPTFSIVNEYKLKESTVYHFDFYRIENESEALDIGIEDYISKNNWCFLEWSEKIPNLIPINVNYINFKVLEDNTRTIELNLNE